MINFQLITIPLLLLLAAWDLRRLLAAHSRRVFHTLRMLVWLTAAALIYYPDFTAHWAQFFGIARGSDLVIYIFMLVTPFVMFHLYAKQFALQRELVLLARRDALREARAGTGLVETWTAESGNAAADQFRQSPDTV